MRNLSILAAPSTDTGTFLASERYDILYIDMGTQVFLLGNPSSGDFLELGWTDAVCKGVNTDSKVELRVYCAPKIDTGSFLASGIYEVLRINMGAGIFLLGNPDSGEFLEIDWQDCNCKGIARNMVKI